MYALVDGRLRVGPDGRHMDEFRPDVVSCAGDLCQRMDERHTSSVGEVERTKNRSERGEIPHVLCSVPLDLIEERRSAVHDPATSEVESVSPACPLPLQISRPTNA